MPLQSMKGVKLSARNSVQALSLARRKVIQVKQDAVLPSRVDTPVAPVERVTWRGLKFQVYIAGEFSE